MFPPIAIIARMVTTQIIIPTIQRRKPQFNPVISLIEIKISLGVSSYRLILLPTGISQILRIDILIR